MGKSTQVESRNKLISVSKKNEEQRSIAPMRRDAQFSASVPEPIVDQTTGQAPSLPLDETVPPRCRVEEDSRSNPKEFRAAFENPNRKVGTRACRHRATVYAPPPSLRRRCKATRCKGTGQKHHERKNKRDGSKKLDARTGLFRSFAQ